MENAGVREVGLRLVRRVGSGTVPVFSALVIALMTVAWGLSQIVRGLDVALLAAMMLLGMVTGWVLGRSRLHGRAALPLALVIAIATVLLRVGQLGGALATFFAALVNFFWQAQFNRLPGQAVLDAFEPLRAGVGTLLTRLQTWIQALMAGQGSADLVASALVWSTLLWLVCAWAAWMLRRRASPFFALAPVLLVYALVLAYTGRDAMLMVVPIVALLLLMAGVPHLARQHRWQSENISAAQDLGFDLAFVAVPAIVGIAFVAAFVPAFSPREISRWVSSLTETQAQTSNAFSDSFGLDPAPREQTVFDTVTAPGLPRSHLLGAGPELLQRPAFSVQTNDALKQAEPYYWLSTTYDIYTGRGWVTSQLQTLDYSADERAPVESISPYRTLFQTVRMEEPQRLVYAAGNLVSLDHEYQIAWRADRDMFAAQVRSGVYRVESRVPIFNAADLRGSETTYPAWIQTQYLALPDSVPPRVLGLARDLTATAPTPYDRALAIETYLRTIPYTLDLDAPPGSRDVVDYFLFDLRRGYCDYYATAMAVLARAAGLPARVAVGYVSGSYDASMGTYNVKEADAHSWTQIYFPRYGWVDFEPTSGRAALGYDVPDTFADMAPPSRENEGAAPVSSFRANIESRWYVVPAALGVVVLAVALFLAFDLIRLRRLPPAAALAQLYQRIFRAAQRLGIPVTPSHTPHQVARLLQAYLESSARTKQLQPLLREASHTTTNIIELYIHITFGAQSSTRAEMRNLVRRWQRARVALWFSGLVNGFRQRI